MTSILHRVRLPAGASPAVKVGARIKPDDVLAIYRPPTEGVTIPISAPLRRAAERASECLVVRPGARLDRGAVVAQEPRGRQVTAPFACLFLGYDPNHGTALVSPLGDDEPIVSHVRGRVAALETDAVEVRVAGGVVTGVGGIGPAVHGTLHVAVEEPGEELRAASIDSRASGRILVGGSRASAEALTRARAMAVAGVVLGGVLDKDLRDFEHTQQRRREVAGGGDLAVLLLEGFGKVGADPGVFAWLRRHHGKTASLFGEERRLYVYEADEPPMRRVLPRAGERVVGIRRPYAGAGGRLQRVLPGLYTASSGIPARSGLVRFDDGRTGIVPLANLEATDTRPEPPAGG